jgi:hypothetical protein
MQENQTTSTSSPQPESNAKKRLKQMGVAGFLFFTIKGLLWLIIPFLIAKGCVN